VNSSLDKIVQDIIGESRAKAEELRKDALVDTEEKLAKEKGEAAREADQIIRSAKSEAETERNRRISQAKQEARLLYLAEKNKVVRGVLEDVRSMLAKFAENDPSYRAFLVKAIARGVEAIPSETVKIGLSKRDLKRFNAAKLVEEALATLHANKKATHSNEPIGTMGGAFVTSEEGKMTADCTLEARLRLMEPQLLAEISKTLFAS
jgi:V/A-type H+-transporting ATPase subunit E